MNIYKPITKRADRCGREEQYRRQVDRTSQTAKRTMVYEECRRKIEKSGKLRITMLTERTQDAKNAYERQRKKIEKRRRT